MNIFLIIIFDYVFLMLSSNTNTNNYTHILPKAVVVDIEANNQPKIVEPQVVGIIKVQQSNSDETKFCPVNAALFCCAGFVVLLLVLPFILCDLYYAYNSISCQHDETPIGISLSTWLKVSGFSAVGVISTLILIFISTACYEYGPNTNLKLVPIQWLYHLFSFAWLIIGCVLFWRYLDQSGECGRDVSDYMWARLIIGLIGVLIAYKTGNKNE